MQQGRRSRNRHADGEPDPFAARSRLVVAGTTALLIGVGCLILGVFVSLSPASEAAVPSGENAAQAAVAGDPLANIPLTSGKAASAGKPQLPIVPVSVKVKRTVVVPTPAATTAAPKKSPEPTPSATPAACPTTWGSGDGNHNYPGGFPTGQPCVPPSGGWSWGGGGSRGK
jgi:hypothetical protein